MRRFQGGNLRRTEARWASGTACSACEAVAKATQKASPTVLKTEPAENLRWPAAARHHGERGRGMASGLLSQSHVLPSRSVNRNVTVPVGKSGMPVSSRQEVRHRQGNSPEAGERGDLTWMQHWLLGGHGFQPMVFHFQAAKIRA